MKIKIYFKFLLSVLFITFFGMIFYITFFQSLSEKRAFMMVYGNYDAIHKNSMWNNMVFSDKEKADEFWQKKTGIVSSILLQSYKENGKKKYLFLTKTIPAGVPFECHACLPLLSAIVFSLEKFNWKIESQNLFLMYDGEYATSPIAKLISVGDNKMGLSLEFEYHNDGHKKEIALVIPYKRSVEAAHREIIYYDNLSDCGWSVQCLSFSASINFIKVKKDDYYELKIKKIGTENDGLHAKAVPVDEERFYNFINGKYLKTSFLR